MRHRILPPLAVCAAGLALFAVCSATLGQNARQAVRGGAADGPAGPLHRPRRAGPGPRRDRGRPPQVGQAHPARPARQRDGAAPHALHRRGLQQDSAGQQRQDHLDLFHRPRLGIRRRVDALQRQHPLHPHAIRRRGDARKEVVWRYDAPEGTEIHACQPIGLDKVMFVQNGLPPKLMVVNIKTKAVEVQHDLPAPSLTDKGRSTRSSAGRATPRREPTWFLSWTWARLSSTTRISRKSGATKFQPLGRRPPQERQHSDHRRKDILTREVNPKKETVWELKPGDLPEAYRYHQHADLHPPGQRQHHRLLPRRRRKRPPARRSHAGQESRLGAAGLGELRPGNRRSDPGRARHPGKPGRIATLGEKGTLKRRTPFPLPP